MVVNTLGMEQFIKKIHPVRYTCHGSGRVCTVQFIGTRNFFFSFTNEAKRVHSRAAGGGTELDANRQ